MERGPSSLPGPFPQVAVTPQGFTDALSLELACDAQAASGGPWVTASVGQGMVGSGTHVV